MNTEAEKTLKDWVKESFNLTTLNDITNHGCIAGFGGLTYYSDTTSLYDEYQADVWELAMQQNDEIGEYNNVLEFIGAFNGAKNVYSEETFKNLMVWYAVEEYARQILEEEELEEEEENV